MLIKRIFLIFTKLIEAERLYIGMRGVANFSMGKIEDSFTDFKLAYSFNPHHLHVLNNIGTIYEIKGNSEVAKKIITKKRF